MVHAVCLGLIYYLFTVPFCSIVQDVGDKEWVVLHQTSHLRHIEHKRALETVSRKVSSHVVFRFSLRTQLVHR